MDALSPQQQFRLTHRSLAPEEMIPPHRGAVSVWTNVKRTGDWILARTFRVIALMGGVEIDLRNARLGPGVSTIEVKCMWGGISILVPDDIHIECEVEALAAGAEITHVVPTRAAIDAPRVRVIGTVLMGGVDIKVVPPDYEP
jgi:hypothetical protein